MIDPDPLIVRTAAAVWGLQPGNATLAAAAQRIRAEGFFQVVDAIFNQSLGQLGNAELAGVFVRNLGITGELGPIATDWVHGALDQVAADVRGTRLFEISMQFGIATQDAQFGAYAQAFNARVEAALALAHQAGSVDQPWAPMGVASPPELGWMTHDTLA